MAVDDVTARKIGSEAHLGVNKSTHTHTQVLVSL